MSSNDTTPANPLRINRALAWTVLFLIYTVIAVLMFEYHYLDDLSRQRTGTFAIRFIEEFTGVYTVFALLPLIFRFTRVYLFKNLGWFSVTLWHIVGAITFTLIHTTLMALTRDILFPILGLGSYDYGIMWFRYPMEASNDLIGYTTIVSLYYVWKRIRLAQAQQLAAAELKTKLAEAQLENLRLQLQPHFLFNTLNTISSVMYEDVRAADAMLTQLSDLLRLTLRTSRAHEIPLAEELEITRLYLEIMQKRYEDKLQVRYAIDPALESTLVPRLVLQPLVENSLRHGMDASASAIEIAIDAHRENGNLVLKVSDTGTGFSGNDPESLFHRGFGLSNIRSRLDHLYGVQNDSSSQISVSSRASGGTEVALRIPFRTAPSES